MIRLEDTNGSAIAAALAAERTRLGASATGMVLTLLILADEESQSDATTAAMAAARQHPMRVLTVIPRPQGEFDCIDADITAGGESGPGELAVVRLRGALSAHANSVVIPLLLPDTPIVAWWPGAAPDVMEDDPIGRHAQRRIADSGAAPDPALALASRRRGYRSGDSDLAWARATTWRSILASALDQEAGSVTSAQVGGAPGDPTGILLASWLQWALRVPTTLNQTEGSGVSHVRIATSTGEVGITRTGPTTGLLGRTGLPDATVALPRRGLDDLIAEELRRLDPDEVFGDVLHACSSFVPDSSREQRQP